MTAVIYDQNGRLMNLALVNDHADPARLTWVQGWKTGKMNCYGITASDVKPWGWHDLQPPVAQAHA
jgi:hypothetical protein